MPDRLRALLLLVVRTYIFLVLFFTFTTCEQKELPAIGDYEIVIFDSEKVNFDPGRWNTPLDTSENQVIRLGAGRLLLRRIEIPAYQRQVTAEVEIRLKSAGDRWDKSGSCFLIPAKSSINFLSLAKEDHNWPIPAANGKAGVRMDSLYYPAIELMRFMTPFGVGAYSDSMESRKPVYIPKWETEVQWHQDVSAYLEELKGECWIGIWIDSWTSEGYEADLTLRFRETNASCEPLKYPRMQSLLNIINYAEGQQLYDVFFNSDLEVDFEIPEQAKNPRLAVVTTGHGGHSGGDEFTRQENQVWIDDRQVSNWIPWRDDCASFRRYNPSSGVWLIPDTARYYDWETRQYREKIIEERQASSDLSRSNWCPGSKVDPLIISLAGITPGHHQLKYRIPGAQQAGENMYNHWLVSVVLLWDE